MWELSIPPLVSTVYRFPNRILVEKFALIHAQLAFPQAFQHVSTRPTGLMSSGKWFEKVDRSSSKGSVTLVGVVSCTAL